jgi:hypothetical protein
MEIILRGGKAKERKEAPTLKEKRKLRGVFILSIDHLTRDAYFKFFIRSYRTL